MPPRLQKIHTENSAFQLIETLRRNREKRHRQRTFFVEGVRSINQMLAHRWTVTAFVYPFDQALSDWAQNILSVSPAAVHYELPAALMAKLSLKNEPSELIALVEMAGDNLDRIPIGDPLLIVLFDRPASPGNLGSIIRSCDALHANGLVLTGHAVDLYDPETISASTGSFFAVPVVRQPSLAEVLPWMAQLRQQVGPLPLIGTSEDAPEAIDDHDFSGPTLLALGNETWGLSAAYQQACDSFVKIPMSGSASSLNVANAASILLYEIDRQRRMRIRAP